MFGQDFVREAGLLLTRETKSIKSVVSSRKSSVEPVYSSGKPALTPGWRFHVFASEGRGGETERASPGEVVLSSQQTRRSGPLQSLTRLLWNGGINGGRQPGVVMHVTHCLL